MHVKKIHLWLGVLTLACSCQNRKLHQCGRPALSCQLLAPETAATQGTVAVLTLLVQGARSESTLQSWRVLNGEKGTLQEKEAMSLPVGATRLHYTPQQAGKHTVEVCIAADGQQCTAQCALRVHKKEGREEAESSSWQGRLEASDKGMVAGRPRALQLHVESQGTWRVKSWQGQGDLTVGEHQEALAPGHVLTSGQHQLQYTPDKQAKGEQTLSLVVENDQGEAKSVTTRFEVASAPPAYQITARLKGKHKIAIDITAGQEKLKKAHWTLLKATWSKGLEAKLQAAARLRAGNNLLPFSFTRCWPQAPPTLQLLIQGPDKEQHTVVASMVGPCLEYRTKDMQDFHSFGEGLLGKYEKENAQSEQDFLNNPQRYKERDFSRLLSALRLTASSHVAHMQSLVAREEPLALLSAVIQPSSPYYPPLAALKARISQRKREIEDWKSKNQKRQLLYELAQVCRQSIKFFYEDRRW